MTDVKQLQQFLRLTVSETSGYRRVRAVTFYGSRASMGVRFEKPMAPGEWSELADTLATTACEWLERQKTDPRYKQIDWWYEGGSLPEMPDYFASFMYDEDHLMEDLADPVHPAYLDEWAAEQMRVSCNG